MRDLTKCLVCRGDTEHVCRAHYQDDTCDDGHRSVLPLPLCMKHWREHIRVAHKEIWRKKDYNAAIALQMMDKTGLA